MQLHSKVGRTEYLKTATSVASSYLEFGSWKQNID